MKTGGRKSQGLGKFGEGRAEWFLREIGARCVEKVSTPFVNVRGRVVYSGRSSVDYVAAVPVIGGSGNCFMASRIEVKVCLDDRLVHSRLKPHQIMWLTEWNNCGFASFVMWVRHGECLLFRYPSDSYMPGLSIGIETARRISVRGFIPVVLK